MSAENFNEEIPALELMRLMCLMMNFQIGVINVASCRTGTQNDRIDCFKCIAEHIRVKESLHNLSLFLLLNKVRRGRELPPAGGRRASSTSLFTFGLIR